MTRACVVAVNANRIGGERASVIVADWPGPASARLPLRGRTRVVGSVALTFDQPQLLVASCRLAFEGDGAVEDLWFEKRLHQLVVGPMA